MARALSGSPWWKTSSVSARLPAACAASLKAALKHCTTWFLSPTGVRHDPEKHLLGLAPGTCSVFGSDRVYDNSFPTGFCAMVAPLRVGIAGLGTVGTEVVRLIERQGRVLSARCGLAIRVTAVTARSKAKQRDLDLGGVTWAKS